VWVNYLAKLEKLTWKQGDGDVMEDWSASCFLPLLLFFFRFTSVFGFLCLVSSCCPLYLPVPQASLRVLGSLPSSFFDSPLFSVSFSFFLCLVSFPWLFRVLSALPWLFFQPLGSAFVFFFSRSLSLSCLPLAQDEDDGDKGTTCCWLNGSSLLCVFSFSSLC